MPDRGHEDGPPRQPREELDLWHMLMLETKRVQLEGRPACAIMRFDHGSAAARVYRDRIGGRDARRLDERARSTDRACRVATGVGGSARRLDFSRLIRR